MIKYVLELTVVQNVFLFYKINVDVIYYCVKNFAWTQKTIIIW